MNTNSLPFGPQTSLSILRFLRLRQRTKPSALVLSSAFWLLSSVLCLLPSAKAASFPGNARVEITDTNGGLSWKTNVNALTVQCWFKLSAPPGLKENMSILMNKRSTSGGYYAYHLYYDYSKNTVEFRTWGRTASGTGCQFTLIARPYQERWYHVALVRDNNNFFAYLDGLQTLTTNRNVGDTSSDQGVVIGGPDATDAGAGFRDLYGEVQEVTIYQMALDATAIRGLMFKEQETITELVGYYKLGYSTNADDLYRNFADTKPPGTDTGVKAGSGQILFEETDRKGEQSLFDSMVSGGKNAIVPLSGSFTWQQSVFNRPVPGIPFDFSIAYSPGASSALGLRWSHSFDIKVVAESLNLLKVITWQGGIETWETTNAVAFAPWSTRHGEYRGALIQDGAGDVLWTNAQHHTYRFNGTDKALPGALTEIRDSNGNAMQIQWDERVAYRYITNIADSAGGQYRLSYSGQLLTNVSHGAWQLRFTYTNLMVAGQSQNFLASKTLTNTSGLYTNVNTTLRFYYNTNGLLERIIDARGNTNVMVRYDDYGRQVEMVNALGYSTRREYGVPDKRQVTTTDTEGFKWTETYDRKGRTMAQRNPLGHETRFTYDEQGNRTSVTDPMGYTTWIAYDDRANVVAQTNALGQISRRTYHPFFNKPVTESDALNWVTTNTYDAKGNLLSRRDALGTLASYTYTTNGLVETQSDANGNTSRFAYDASGFRVVATDAAGFTKHSLPNDVGWTLAITNALDGVTTYAYDLYGNTVLTIDPLGRRFAGTYDANGNLLTQTDPKGQQASYTYDALNQKTSEVDRGGGTNRIAYTPRGKVSAITNALGRATRYQYDAAGRETNAVDALGNSVGKVYDANGNAVALIDPSGQRWTKVVDRLNRTVAVTDPFGNTTRTFFDATGRIRGTVATDGSSAAHGYDGRGRMIARTNSVGSVVRYDYDGVGNITNVTDSLGGHYVLVYGDRNELMIERNQDANEWQYTYDALLRLKTRTEPDGTDRTVEYDAGNRVASVTFNTGRVNSFLYDDNDNPVVLSRSGSGPATLSQLSYDAMDRVQQYTDAFYKSVRYSYDPAGRLTSLTYPDGKVLTNRYDTLDRLTNQVFQFSAQQAFTNAFAYDQFGRLIRRVYPNGIVQTNTFDLAGRLAGLSHAPVNPQPAALNIAFGYAYDGNGNTIQSTSQGTFEWPLPAPRQELARYTAAARLIDRSITATGATNPQPSTIAYFYDQRGNMTNALGNGQSWSLTYDEDNRTTSIVWDSGITARSITNRYDALGRRIARTADGILTGYVLDLAGGMERILCDLDAARNITGWYVHGADLSFKVAPDGRLTCYHPDAQGNIIALTDDQANTVAEYAYTPYGRSLGSTNSPAPLSNPYLFVGSQGVMEELPGLYFMRARYYSAEAGVFLSTDPVKNIGPTWLPFAFVYAEGNPLRFNDPNGEAINFILAGVMAVGGAILGGGIDMVVQLVETGGDFTEVNWGSVGIAAGAGFIQGGVAGLTMGASLVAQALIGAGVGAATSFLQTGFTNLTEDKAFVESPGQAITDVVIGGALGAIPGGKIKPKLKPNFIPKLSRELADAPSTVGNRLLDAVQELDVSISTQQRIAEMAEEIAENALPAYWGATKSSVTRGLKDAARSAGVDLFSDQLFAWFSGKKQP